MARRWPTHLIFAELLKKNWALAHTWHLTLELPLYSPMSSASSAPPSPPASSSSSLSLYPDHFQDSYSSFPARTLSYGHALREAIHTLLPGVVKFSLTALTVGYIGYSSSSRGVHAGRLERHPELARKSLVSASMDSALTLWLECITLPGLLTGLTHPWWLPWPCPPSSSPCAPTRGRP